MIRVVTIAREFGSGGAEVAERLAPRLGWRLLDKWLIEEIARRAGVEVAQAARCDERVESALHRVLRNLWQGGYEGTVASTAPSRVSVFDADEMAKMADTLIQQAAELGTCVVLGRGGQCLLQERADTLHVFVYAPLAERIERVRRRLGPQVDAEALIIKKDREREVYVRRRFGQNWCDRHLYHGMVSTCMGVDAVVEFIAAAVEGRNG